MPFDPDTEIQYRKGGKIMKKTPRKFQAGGTTTPAPKPAPKGGPKELQDEAEKLRQEARDKKQQEAGQRRPNLGLKKGGKVKKFGEGGDVDWVPQAKYRNLGDFFRGKRMEDEPKAETKAPEAPLTRQGGSDYLPQKPVESAEDKAAMDAASAMASGSASSYAAQAKQDAPSGIKGGENVVTEVKKEVPKAPKPTAPKRVAPKAVAPKAAPKKATPESDNPFKRGFDQSNAEDARIKRLGKKPEGRGATGSFDKKPEGIDVTKYSIAERRAMPSSKRGSRAEDIYPSLMGKKAGGVVKKYAKGGGVEAKGKTKGKIVKMATGGSVRGYGVSKVTNKTKYV
jgi:hypothetical protein